MINDKRNHGMIKIHAPHGIKIHAPHGIIIYHLSFII